MQSDQNLANTYNSLLGIAEANRRLDELGGEQIVGKLLSIIADSGLERYMGIRLLHKHNDISAEEVMFESATTDDEGFALVTTAARRAKVGETACNSWRYSEGRYAPIEFSDRELMEADFDIYEHSDVLDRLAVALMENHAFHVLGPCINYSKRVMDRAPSSDAAFLEKTDAMSRSNVVRFVMRDDAAFTNSAKTKWYARRSIDASGNAIWTTACNCFCTVFPEGGHQGTTTHRYTPDEKQPSSLSSA